MKKQEKIFKKKIDRILVFNPKMGGKRRNKFERIFSESESEESMDEDSPKSPQNEVHDKEDKESSKNSNNNNSETLTNSSPKKGNDYELSEKQGNSKFLVTRLKRKYTKPEINLKNIGASKNNIVKLDNKEKESNKEKEIESLSPPNKKRKETIKSLDEKIKNANDFLTQLNQKLLDRDKEINDLKLVISQNRNSSPKISKKQGEVQALIEGNLGPSLPAQLTFHDFPILGDDQESAESQDNEMDFEEQDFAEQNQNKKKKRNRSRTRSTSRGRHEDTKRHRRSKSSRSRSRSRSRNRLDDDEKRYREDPMVKNLVKKMVEEQVKREMEKRIKLDKMSGMENIQTSFKITFRYNIVYSSCP